MSLSSHDECSCNFKTDHLLHSPYYIAYRLAFRASIPSRPTTASSRFSEQPAACFPGSSILTTAFSHQLSHQYLVPQTELYFSSGAFGGNRGAKPVPPEKGVFPLDHLHECDQEKKEYVVCLKSSGFQLEKCRHLSKKYLQCRMDRNLMAKQDMAELGFRSDEDETKILQLNEK
ncbi:hypothetical protein KSP40_PGU015346 [Platanthera guangdongensis]|uniref:CHCH domain-containing protein n=1 Tax=Platanthera guangdongensis TaxID=2320717 RepID=A0ABR2LD27_9ASPA